MRLRLEDIIGEQQHEGLVTDNVAGHQQSVPEPELTLAIAYIKSKVSP
jgi:hypothetical protein